MDNIADSSDWLDNCSFYLKNSHNENSCMAMTKTEQIPLVRTKSDIFKKSYVKITTKIHCNGIVVKVTWYQKVFNFGSDQPNKVPNHSLEQYPPKRKMLKCDFSPLVGNFSQNEKLSEIKPPLVPFYVMMSHDLLNLVTKSKWTLKMSNLVICETRSS